VSIARGCPFGEDLVQQSMEQAVTMEKMKWLKSSGRAIKPWIG
jgi:hypothetical protein